METSFTFFHTLDTQVHFPDNDAKNWEQYLSSRHAVLAEAKVAPLAWVWYPDEDFEDQADITRCLVLRFPIAAESPCRELLVCGNITIASLFPCTAS